MVLVFILLAILILILTIFFLILISTFRIEIKDLEATNMKEKTKNQENLNSNDNTQNTSDIKKQNTSGYAIILSLYLFNKLKWFSMHLNDEKIRKATTNMQLEKIDFKKLGKDFKWEDLQTIKKLQVKISYFNLKMELGTESPVVTAFLVAIFSVLISIMLPYVATNIKKENYEYIIQPIYKNQNLYKIQFNCIIQVKMVHIINVIYIFLKKRRSDSNERTASDRRSYGYSYE